ncbi:unnamed protein product [Penicillium nalgiovense]|nr:unnamed protein product [Penicillium nalgiovense]
MDSSAKRETILPGQLWSQKGVTSVKKSGLNASAVNEDTGGQISPPKRVFEKTRLGIPVKASEKNVSLAISKKSSLDKYHKSYNIDQAGRGVIALKDTENLPVCLIKDYGARDVQSIRGLQFASHRNLVSLIDHFQSEDILHLVYEYEHLAISLGCVAGTVQFTEADIATICKEILEGLKFIHLVLRTSYGLLDFSNILLTWQGEVKLANIGECLLNKHTSITIRKDIQDVGSMIVFLSDRTISLLQSNNGLDMPSLSRLAHSFVQKTKEDTTVEQLVNVSISDFCFVLWHR